MKQRIDLDVERLQHPLMRRVFAFLVVFAGIMVAVGSALGWTWLLLVGVFCLALLVWGRFVEPQLLTVKRFRIPLVNAPKAWVRIAFVSDLHAGLGKHRPFFARVVRRVQREKPDVILMGGDAVEDRVSGLGALSPFAQLKAPGGTFFILGNHDFVEDPEPIREQFRSWGWQDATNRSQVVTVRNHTFELVGLEEYHHGLPDVELLRHARMMPRLLLIHGPEAMLDVPEGSADLALAGHTHGGQIRLPFIGPILPLPQQQQQMDRGLRRSQGMPLLISQGLGEADMTARLLCPPQIVIADVGV